MSGKHSCLRNLVPIRGQDVHIFHPMGTNLSLSIRFILELQVCFLLFLDSMTVHQNRYQGMDLYRQTHISIPGKPQQQQHKRKFDCPRCNQNSTNSRTERNHRDETPSRSHFFQVYFPGSSRRHPVTLRSLLAKRSLRPCYAALGARLRAFTLNLHMHSSDTITRLISG